MRNTSIALKNVQIKDIQHHFKDTLIQFFYVLGIEPINLDISEFTNEKKFLLNDFKEVQLITKFPSSGRIQSDIDPTILMCHCFQMVIILLKVVKNLKMSTFISD